MTHPVAKPEFCDVCGHAVGNCPTACPDHLRPLDMRAAQIIGQFLAFQNAGYLANQPFETTYAVLAKDAREFLRSRGAL